jgi:hypothetical protein
MKRLERICAIILLFSVLITTYLMVSKITIEKSNNLVEISVPANELQMLSVAVKAEPKQILEDFQQAGLTSLIVQETTLRDMVNVGRALILNGWQLMDHQRFLGITADVVIDILSEKDFNPRSYYVFTKDRTAFELLKEFIPARGFDVKTYEGQEIYIIQEVKGIGGFSDIGLGIERQWIDLATQLGLNVNVIAREMHKKTVKEIEFLVSNLEKQEISIFIPQNNQLPEDPNAQMIFQDYLRKNEVLLGVDEFNDTAEILRMAEGTGYEIVRVYNRPLHKWMDEYLLAVRDRNDRLLYLHLFLSGQDDLISYNQEHINQITTSIRKNGIVNDFSFGKAESFKLLKENKILSFCVSLGILWAVAKLMMLAGVPPKAGYIISALGLMLMVSLAVIDFSLYRDVISLAVAVIFPVVGIYSQMKTKRNVEEKKPQYVIGYAAKGFSEALSVALIGGLLLWGICANSEFLLGFKQFRGIKLLYILSYGLIIALYIKDNYGLSINKPILSIASIMMLLIVGAIFFVLINRTGNFSVIPIPKWEISFRIWLENVLPIRPRTKEFLIGFPALIIAGGTKALGKSRCSTWLYIVALLGLVSTVNTFSHFHISSLISIIRTLEGAFLGIMIGAGVLGGLYLYEKRSNRYNA